MASTRTSKKGASRDVRAHGVQLGEHLARGMILQGAAVVFAKQGVRAASVEEILAAANVSRRTFYRLYDNKDDVALALYRVGTDLLTGACRAAVVSESDALRQIELCIDAHLENARALGRLVFVLGGEAQRLESPLHTRRMETHAQLVSLLAPGAERHVGHAVDPLVIRTLLLALEGVVRIMLEEGEEGRRVSDAGIRRARAAMMRIATATLAGRGPGVAPMPRRPG